MPEIFLITGPEPLQFHEKVQSFSLGAKEKYGDFSFNTLSYKGNSLQEIIQEISSPSFFCEKKIVRIDEFPPPANRNSSKKNNQEGKEREKSDESDKEENNQSQKKSEEIDFLKILEGIDENTVIIFTSLNPDKRTSFYKGLSKIAKKTYEFPLWDEKNQKEIILWTKKRAEKYGISLSPQIAEFLRMFVGNSFLSIDQELKKLLLCCGEKNISEEDITTICLQTEELPNFALADAILSGNIKKIFKTQMELSKNEDVITIFYRDIVSLFRNLILVSSSIKEKKESSEIKMHPFVLQKTKKILQNISQKKLLSAYAKIQEIDSVSKKGQIPLSGDTRIFLLKMEKVLLDVFS